MFFSVYTLGCKLNQLETEAIADSFSRGGFTLVPWNAKPGSKEPSSTETEILIINTCTVTSMAEQKARRVIRKALRDNPEACLIVTGCYAQMEKIALCALGENSDRFFIVPGEKKDSLLDLPKILSGAGSGKNTSFPGSTLPGLIGSWALSLTSEAESKNPFRFQPEKFSSHSRSFLKIQDGCDRHCAYCRVSLARGKSQSLGAKEVLGALKSLEQKGFAEVVLTGVNIFQYRDGNLTLPGLLEFLLTETESIRIRLSSIELETDFMSGDFCRVLENKRIRPHFHLSVQSFSDRILSKMRRPYTAGDLVNAVNMLRSVKEDPFLACDIIAAFPGETEEDFKETFELCKKTGFAWIHAFSFSPRPGTEAFDFSPRVNDKEAARRVALLTELAWEGRLKYIQNWEGKEVEAVVEAGKREVNGFVPGVSENYLKLLINYGTGPAPNPGSLVRCRILSRSKDSPELEKCNFDAEAEIII